jgi:hypothetical protein
MLNITKIAILQVWHQELSELRSKVNICSMQLYTIQTPILVKSINSERNTTRNFIGPHLTLVFPFPDFLSDITLIDHVESVIKDWPPFTIHLRGLRRSLDDYLFLLVKEGSANLLDDENRIVWSSERFLAG